MFILLVILLVFILPLVAGGGFLDILRTGWFFNYNRVERLVDFVVKRTALIEKMFFYLTLLVLLVVLLHTGYGGFFILAAGDGKADTLGIKVD